jgi:hypothetical protein
VVCPPEAQEEVLPSPNQSRSGTIGSTNGDGGGKQQQRCRRNSWPHGGGLGDAAIGGIANGRETLDEGVGGGLNSDLVKCSQRVQVV